MFKAARTIGVCGLVFAMSAAAADEEFSTKFPLVSCEFISWGGNLYFPLIPGRQ